MDIQDLSLVRRVPPITGRVLAVVLAAFVALSGLFVMQTPPSTGLPTVVTSSGKLSLSFVPDSGQADPEVRFVVRGMGGTLFFTPDGVMLASPAAVARLRFEGANPSPELAGVDRLPGVVNYFLGNDPTQWRTSVPTYGGVVYRQLYPGVDLSYDGLSGNLKGTYTVAPGGDPSRIHWRYEGATDVRADEVTGNLLVSLATKGPHPNPLPAGDGAGTGVLSAGEGTGSLPEGTGDGPLFRGERTGSIPARESIAPWSPTLVEGAPVAWQMVDGRRVPVEARYVLYGNMAAPAVGFALGSYDPALPLTIDPTLAYSTYLGGSKSDKGFAIAVDAGGNAYITGETYSTDFSGVSGGSGDADAFVAKLNPTGSAVLYTTYLGGNSKEQGRGIAVDGAGNAYVTGWTTSSNFPTLNPVQATLSAGGATNAFITKLNATGALSYSTYAGQGSYVTGLGIAVDSAGGAYVTGNNSGFDFFDVLIVKLDAAGAQVYANSFGPGHGNAIAVDGSGNAYITGQTGSDVFPTTPGALQPSCGKANFSVCQDAFIAKVSRTGTELLYSTYLGGTGPDEGFAIAVDGPGNIYVAGKTSSLDFPTVTPVETTPCSPSGVCVTGFVAKLSASGSSLQYSTYLGGDNYDWATGIAVDSSGSAYVVGTTQSRKLPVIDPVQPGPGGGICNPALGSFRNCYDAFVVKLTPGGNALVYSTYLGGSGDEEGNGIAVDGAGNAYVTGFSESPDFPTTGGVVRPSFEPDREAFVSKIGPAGAAGATPTATPIGSVTPTATPTGGVTPTATPTGGVTPTATPSPTVTTTPAAGLSPWAYLPLTVRSYGGAW